MIRRMAGMAAMMAMSAAPVAAQSRTASGVVEGLWINPASSVAVRTGACNDHLCGWIVWADRAAAADARSGGVAALVGTELLVDYAARGDGSWTGMVFVPDMGRRFASTLVPLGRNAIRVKGCLVGGLLCKAQVWQRIEHLPHE
ncbi:DUF2147 domain-containing protein [Sphingomonas abaci]|uniref:Uncharacterized protein (DUF2147 family) n=1 Tax=Sphingomonas abaci TaxID=237611 RepID=A0A7W7AHK3_9SPHN|nr:DUF2147 domain-containing protein [Sphingomonas abaci]MBB4617155.1 uncharacterized protein (DUF2147 family) [Sphingomonas abaci]